MQPNYAMIPFLLIPDFGNRFKRFYRSPKCYIVVQPNQLNHVIADETMSKTEKGAETERSILTPYCLAKTLDCTRS